MNNFMMITKRLSAAVCLCLLSSQALASFVVADLDSAHADPALGTNVVIAGQGLEAGMLWLSAAHTQALVFKDRLPHGVIKLVSAVNDSRKATYLATLKEWGYENLKFSSADFTGDQLNGVLIPASPIASLNFVGHDGGFLGFALQDEGADHRYYTKDVDVLARRANFTADSYVRILGCNTGWYLAPYMAMKLKLPAAGTLTSADVEIMATSKGWYFDDVGEWPSHTAQANVNAISYSSPVHCQSLGGCIRLKAVNTNYIGQHGTYIGALPFLKFFCGSIPQEDCDRRMALSTRTLIGVNSMSGDGSSLPTREQFAATLADQFCPPPNAATRKTCLQEVTDHITGARQIEHGYTTLPDAVPLLTCTFQRCQFKVTTDNRGQRIFQTTGPHRSNVMADELDSYVRGYQLLAQ